MIAIELTYETGGLDSVVVENAPAGDSILEVALTNNIAIFHKCGMVCACSTCHVYIEEGNELLVEMTERERDFLDQALDLRPNSRLGCQCVLLDDSGRISVSIPDQARIEADE